MKKTITLLLAACIIAVTLVGCASSGGTDATSTTPLPNDNAPAPYADKTSVWRWVTEPTIEIEKDSLEYRAMQCFKNGMGVFAPYNESEYAIINKYGQKITLPQEISPIREGPLGKSYYDGLLLVENKQGLYGYANENGELVIDCQYKYAEDFSEGLAAVGYDITS